MRHILFITFLFVTTVAKSQSDSSISFVAVQKLDSAKSSDLFYKAQMWVNDNFKSGKDVIQISDKETGTLTGKGIIKVPYAYKFYGKTTGESDFSFSFKILVRDEKYKYEFSDFENVSGFKGAIDSRIGNLTSVIECPIRWTGWSQKVMNEIWASSKNGLNLKMEQFINSFRIVMALKKSQNDF